MHQRLDSNNTPMQIDLTANTTVIRKLQSRQKQARTVNQHKDPDFDLENQIIHEITALNNKSKR
jgi:hypothetical protein